MLLRPAALADIETLLTHRREMFRSMSQDNERNLPHFEDASRAFLESAIADGSYFALLGEIDGVVVAGGGVLIAHWPGGPLNFDARRAWILNIYVHPDHRRHGHASSVLEALIAWCRENGFHSVALHASAEGRSLYEKFGFIPTNEMRLRL